MAFSMKKGGIPGGWKISKESSITQYCLGPVEHYMEEKYKIPGGCNSLREANNTQCDSGHVERMMRRRER